MKAFSQYSYRSRVSPCNSVQDRLRHENFTVWDLQNSLLISENFLREIFVIFFSKKVASLQFISSNFTENYVFDAREQRLGDVVEYRFSGKSKKQKQIAK